MIQLTTIVGARPQIIKAAAVSRAIREWFSDRISERIIHTGQHYDRQLSQVFFDELQVPAPHVNLEVGSHDHGKQTGLMITRIEEELKRDRPDAMMVYGDTNTTLAGALAAAKLHIPVIHVEAGMRSFDKTMPEEINRVLCDHVSTLLFTPTLTGVNNLVNEGFRQNTPPPYRINHPGIYHCGDVMYDNCLYFQSVAREKSTILQDNQLVEGQFVLVTLHRAANTDDTRRLTALFETLLRITGRWEVPAIFPLHPRTSKQLRQLIPETLLERVRSAPLLKLLAPVSYLDMISLEKNARVVLTDSGGVQKEAYFFQKPCIILRNETEWTEIVDNQAAILADADPVRILDAFEHYHTTPPRNFPPVFGDGHAAVHICRKITEDLE